MIDFSIPPELEAARQRATAFMEEHVYPNEDKLVEDEGLPLELERELQQRVKALGLWAPHLPRAWGGMGIGFIGQALVNEIAGRSAFAPRLFGNAAPDAGNAELLLIAATAAQQEKYLRPLADGDVRSCFAMTEPEVAGSDPTGLRTTAVRDGEEWVINGHKWFISGAIGSAFAIVMAVTDPTAGAHGRASMILVPTGNARFQHRAGGAGDGLGRRRRPLRDSLRKLPRAGGQSARRVGPGLQVGAGAAGPRPDSALHALGGRCAAQFRNDVQVCAQATVLR